MKSPFKILCIVTAILFVYLFSLLFFMSDSFITDIGLEPSLVSLVLCRRVAMFMLGIAVLTFCARNMTSSSGRQIICISLVVSMFGLSCMGAYEYAIGNVNSAIFPAIVIEIILWLSFGYFAIKDRTVHGMSA